MSRDNRVVVLSTINARGEKEWRIAHVQAAENLRAYDDQPDIRRYLLEWHFGGSTVYTIESEAWRAAFSLEQKNYPVEYDVDSLHLTIDFPTAPEFKHDSDCCTSLGRHWDGERLCDLYVCRGLLPTVLARYSDEESDYVSGMAFVGQVEALTEAHRRAVKRGLLPERLKLPE